MTKKILSSNIPTWRQKIGEIASETYQISLGMKRDYNVDVWEGIKGREKP
jgi:hypothetical protein